MTLVIARRLSRGVRVLSDLRVSHPEMRRNGLPHGVLKTVVLNPNVCACFAGSVGLGAHAIAELATNAGHLTAEQVVVALRLAHERSIERSEFLVAQAHPPRLWKISNGHVGDDEAAAWIGDFDAFERFQELFHGPALSFRPPPEFDPTGSHAEASQLMDAFRLVIADDQIESVGDARVVASADEDGFRYLPYMEIDNGLDPPSFTVGPGEEASLLRVGTAAIGAFAYSLLTPVDAGVGLVAVHVLQAALGFIYYPAASTDAIVYSSVTQAQLIDRIKADYGIEVGGFGFQVSI